MTAFEVGQRVRFSQNARFSEWSKGDLGQISKVLVGCPQAQYDIYIVKLESGKETWCTSEDVVAHNQLSLF